MINILYTILLFNILIIVFKMFQKYEVDNLQALIINYLTAAICSFFFIETDFTITYILQSNWLYHAIVIGALFIIVFYFFSLGIQQVGISITTVANKMSLIIPVCAALILYPTQENLTLTKVMAFLLAFLGIYLSSTQGGRITFNKKYIWLIVLVFFGQGISDAIFNDFAQRFNNFLAIESYLFFMTLFLMAVISGCFIYVVKSISSGIRLQLKSIFWGIVFGVPNFFSLVFFLKALEDPNILSSEVFPLVSMGVVISSSIIGLFVFKERITINNWIGILLSMCAIYLFSF